MVVQDLWVKRDGSPSKRHGRGMRFRVVVDGYPASSCRTRREADMLNARRVAAGPPRPESTVSVGELLDTWLAGKKHLRPASLSACRLAARRVRAQWGLVAAVDVTAPRVQAWVSGMEAGEGGDVRPASRSTRAQALQALHGALQVAVDSGWLERNAAAGVRLGRTPRREARFLTVEQVRMLADVVGGDAPLVWLLATTGLRVGEAVALDVGDVDGSRGRLRVRRSKTGLARDVPVPKSVLRMLSLERGGGEPLFLAAQGGRVDVHNWRARVWRPAVEACGLSPLRIHDLRHTAASLAIASGADVKAVQSMLGHASASMTLDLYGHLFDSTLDAVAGRMDAMVKGSKGRKKKG